MGRGSQFFSICPFFLPVYEKISTRILFSAVCATGYPIHIFSADRTNVFQQIYHTIHRRCPNGRILRHSFVVNFLAAGTILI